MSRVFLVSHWSVATRIIVACVGIALVLAGATTAIGYFKASAGLAEQGDARLNSDATVVARIVDDWNVKHLGLARAAAALPMIVRGLQAGDNVSPEDIASITDTLAALGAGAGPSDTSTVTVINAAGSAPFSPTAAGVQFSSREYFQKAVKGQDFISGVTMAIAGTGAQTIFASTPVKAADGKILGVVVALGDPSTIQKNLDTERDRLSKDTVGVLMDEQGLVIANTIDKSWLLRPIVTLQPDVLQTLLAGKRWGNNVPAPDALGEQGLVPAIGVTQPTNFKWDRHGITYHAVAMPLTQTKWTYVTALPIATFEAATQDLLRTSALAVAVGLVLAFLAIMLLVRPITSGLRRLTAAARGLASGDTHQELDLVGHDEIGQMASAFRDVMAYQRSMADVADAVADGDLTRNVELAAVVGVATLFALGPLRPGYELPPPPCGALTTVASSCGGSPREGNSPWNTDGRGSTSRGLWANGATSLGPPTTAASSYAGGRRRLPRPI